jgi:intein/homing endonuclease
MKMINPMCCCLSGDTSILLSDGSSRAIKSIRIGQMVMTPGHKAAFIHNICEGHETLLLKIEFGNKFVEMTANHPVLTPSGYVKAELLKVNSEICVYDRNGVANITSVKTKLGDFKVYNLDTENNTPFIANSMIVGSFNTQYRL